MNERSNNAGKEKHKRRGAIKIGVAKGESPMPKRKREKKKKHHCAPGALGQEVESKVNDLGKREKRNINGKKEPIEGGVLSFEVGRGSAWF